jgi:hypothetical protein
MHIRLPNKAKDTLAVNNIDLPDNMQHIRPKEERN